MGDVRTDSFMLSPLRVVDAAFIQSCVQQKLDFQARLQDVVQGAIKPSSFSLLLLLLLLTMLTFPPPWRSDHSMLDASALRRRGRRTASGG